MILAIYMQLSDYNFTAAYLLSKLVLIVYLTLKLTAPEYN